jgi:hypothetical protein
LEAKKVDFPPWKVDLEAKKVDFPPWKVDLEARKVDFLPWKVGLRTDLGQTFFYRENMEFMKVKKRISTFSMFSR